MGVLFLYSKYSGIIMTFGTGTSNTLSELSLADLLSRVISGYVISLSVSVILDILLLCLSFLFGDYLVGVTGGL